MVCLALLPGAKFSLLPIADLSILFRQFLVLFGVVLCDAMLSIGVNGGRRWG